MLYMHIHYWLLGLLTFPAYRSGYVSFNAVQALINPATINFWKVCCNLLSLSSWTCTTRVHPFSKTLPR